MSKKSFLLRLSALSALVAGTCAFSNYLYKISSIPRQHTDDKEDFDNEAEYEAVMENNLPETIKIPISQLYGFGSVDDYISNEYDYCIKSIGSIDVISTKYQLTDAGRKKCERYIAELKAKRKEILDAGLDTADNTPVPTVQDIEDDLNFTGLIDETEYLNTFGATDSSGLKLSCIHISPKMFRELINTNIVKSSLKRWNKMQKTN